MIRFTAIYIRKYLSLVQVSPGHKNPLSLFIKITIPFTGHETKKGTGGGIVKS